MSKYLVSKNLDSFTDKAIQQIFNSAIENLNNDMEKKFYVRLIDATTVPVPPIPEDTAKHNQSKDYSGNFLVVRYLFAKDKASLKDISSKEDVIPNLVFLSEVEVAFVPGTAPDRNSDLFELNQVYARYILNAWNLFLQNKIGKDRSINIPTRALYFQGQKQGFSTIRLPKGVRSGRKIENFRLCNNGSKETRWTNT